MTCTTRTPSGGRRFTQRRRLPLLLLLAGLVLSLLAGVPATADESNSRQPSATEIPDVEAILSQDPEHLRYLGMPVSSKIASPPAVGQEDGRWVVYRMYKGAAGTESPGTFTVTDIETGEVIRAIKMADAQSSAALKISSDGRVYVATYHDYQLYQYDPATKALNNLGPIIQADPKTGYAFGMTEGPEGKMLIGTYPTASVFEYDPATDTITDLGRMSDTESYVHGMAYDPKSDNLYVGVGGKKATILKITDAGHGTKTAITNETKVPGLEAETFVSQMRFVSDHLVARTKNNKLLVIDADGNVDYWVNERGIVGYTMIADINDPNKIIYSNAGHFWTYDITTAKVAETPIPIDGYLGAGTWIESTDAAWPGHTLVGADAGGVFRASFETGQQEAHPTDYAQPTLIQKTLRGPDDRMFDSGYMVGLAEVNTEGGDPFPTVDFGQVESSILRDGKMYLGSYGNSVLSVFDPAKPTVRPTKLFDTLADGQDRPFAMAYNPDLDQIYMGSVPGYGKTQGGLTVYDVAANKHHTYTTDIVDDQSLISVAYNKNDGLVYIGTTIDGGLGSNPTGQTEAKLIVWDPVTKTKVRELVPVADREGVTGLMIGPDGLLWGVAEDTIFRYDTATNKIISSAPLLGRRYVEGSTYWAFGYLYTSPIDGRVYGSAGSQIFVIDPTTMKFTRLVNGANWANIDQTGDVYFAKGVHAFKYILDVPVPPGKPTATNICPVLEGLIDGRAVATDANTSLRWLREIERLDRAVETGRGKELHESACG